MTTAMKKLLAERAKIKYLAQSRRLSMDDATTLYALKLAKGEV